MNTWLFSVPFILNCSDDQPVYLVILVGSDI